MQPLIALALALPAPAPAPPAFSPVITARAASVVETRIAGQRAVVATPPRRTDRVVIVAHGAGHGAVSILNDMPMITGRLLARGYTVVSSDAHGDAWGNRASRRDYVAVARAMRGRGLRRVFVLARSMGGLAALATTHRIRPLAWAGIYPACNLGSLDRFRARIVRAHGAPWRRLAADARLNPVRPRMARGLPMIFWASPGDTVVSKARNTDLCAAAARRAGADVRVVTTRGDHGHRSNFDPDRLAAFFDAAARGARERRDSNPRPPA